MSSNSGASLLLDFLNGGHMAYKHTNTKGVTYYLNTKSVTLRGGREMNIYFFSKDERPETACDLPEGRSVVENGVNGFLTVKATEK